MSNNWKSTLDGKTLLRAGRFLILLVGDKVRRGIPRKRLLLAGEIISHEGGLGGSEKKIIIKVRVTWEWELA